MMNRHCTAALVGIVLVLAACEGASDDDEAAPVPADAKSDAAPSSVTVSPEQLALGAQAYAAQCVTCHGAGGAGNGPMVAALKVKPRSFSSDEWKFVDFAAGDVAVHTEIERVIRDGIKEAMMPSYDKLLNSDEVTGLVAYVLELRADG